MSENPMNEQDINSQLTTIQEQLTLLGHKLDILISETFKSRQHGGVHGGQPQNQPQPGQKHGQPQAQQQQKAQQNQQQKKQGKPKFKAVCAECQQECELPFQPKSDRPVYCDECWSKRKGSGRSSKKEANKESNKVVSPGDEFEDFTPAAPEAVSEPASAEGSRPKDVTPSNEVVKIDWRTAEPKPVPAPVEKRRGSGRGQQRSAARKKSAAPARKRPAPKKK